MKGSLSARLVYGLCLTVLAAAVVAGPKQTPADRGAAPQTKGSGVIIGRVVDADSGAAIPAAIVYLNVTPAPPSRTSSASGTAVGGATVQTQAGAPIQTLGSGSVAFIVSSPTRVLTDGDGRFVFRDVVAGACRFVVEAQAYSGGGYHQAQPDGPSEALDLTDGQRVGDVVLKMWKGAAITGRVIDEAGEPVVGVFVRVMRRVVVGGQTTLQLGGAGRPTDDRGVYRASGMRPGDYVVEVPTTRTTMPISTIDAVAQQAQGDASGTTGIGTLVAGQVQTMLSGGRSGQQVGNLLLTSGGFQGVGAGTVTPAATDDGRLHTYPTMFYPAATVSTRATVITLHSGEERSGIDIQLTLVPAFRISGVLTDTDGSPVSNMALHLLALDDQNNVDATPDYVAMTVSGPHGDFTILAVPPGQYMLNVLRAAAGGGARGRGMPSGADTAPPAWAKAPVSIADRDVSGVSLTLRAALGVTGHVAFDGESPRPTGAQLGRGIQLQLEDAGFSRGGRGGNAATVAQISADGSFAVTGAIPGKYMISAPGWPALKWKAKSISADGRDLSDLPVELDSSDLANVVVTFTDKPGALTGTVRHPTGELDTTALVVGFPVDSHAWGSAGIHTFSARVTSSGTYSVASMAPGEYNVVAVAATLAQTWQSPEVLTRIVASAVRVHVDDGAHATQDLTTSTIR